MSNDTKWIIGTVVGAVLTVAGLLLAQFGGVNARIDDLRNDLRDFRTDVDTRMEGFDTRLRDVEVALGVSWARSPGAALAGAGVVARGHPGPGAGMARFPKGSQVRSDLDQDGAGAAAIAMPGMVCNSRRGR